MAAPGGVSLALSLIPSPQQPERRVLRHRPTIWSEIDPRLCFLADYFMSLGHRREVDPAAIGTVLLPMVYMLRLEPQEGKSVRRMRVGLTGTMIDEAMNRPLRNRYLDDFIHGPRGADVLAAYLDCATTHTPFWMRQVGIYREGKRRFVEGIGVYLEPDCIYGGLVLRDIMARKTTIPDFVHAVIA